MSYTFNPYPGDYTQYGYQPEFNWFDFLYGGGAGSDGSSPPAVGSSSGASNTPATPARPTAGAPPGVLSALLNRQDRQTDAPFGGGPAMPTAHTTSPYGGEAPSIKGQGALVGLANMLDPTPGNLITEGLKFAYDPTAYVDTKPMTIPGVGSFATQPGLIKAFMGNIPFGGALANVFGQATANKLADIANGTRQGKEGFGIGNYTDDYGRVRTVGTDPSGPFGTNTLTGPGSFGWQRTHQILHDLQGQNAGRGPAGGGLGSAGWGHEGATEPRDPSGRHDSGFGGDHEIHEHGYGSSHGEKMAKGGRVRGALELHRNADGVYELPKFKKGGFWNSIVHDVLPVVAGGATSYLTGSDILGGLATGVSSKLLGNDWATSAGLGALTGLGSWATGLSGDGPGMLGDLFGSTGASGLRGATGSIFGAPSGTNTGGGGFLDSVGNWISGNPEKALLGGAAALSLLAGSGGAKSVKASDDYQDPGNDPEYTKQVKKGWTLDRSPTTPTGDYNWYAYGQVPEFQYFNNVNAPAVPNMAKGGPAPGSIAAGNRSALAILGSVKNNAKGGGQDDVVPAMLAKDEHVIDADVVAAIGDGSSDEGHRKLEDMKKKIRRTKRSAGLDSIPPKAKSPLDYLVGAN